MPGETDLAVLLAECAPALLDGEFVFLTEAHHERLGGLEALASFREEEGLSVVVSKAAAQSAGCDIASSYRCVKLSIHSSLQAVGLTAAVSACLAEAGIPANIVAAYHHDYVFVPTDRANAAMTALKELKPNE